MMVCCATLAGPTGNGGGITGNGGGFAVGSGGGGGGGETKRDMPGNGGGAASEGLSGKTTLGNFPSKLGSSARMRSINGGCVAIPRNLLLTPFAKNK